MTNTTTAAPPELHPDWCARKDDCYDQIPDAATHATSMMEQGAAQAQVEQIVAWVGGHNVVSPPHALVWMKGDPVGEYALSAADCRDLAAVLSATADKLDGLPPVDAREVTLSTFGLG